jgi:hypothetical protein
MTTTDLLEQLVLFTAADLDPAELTWEEIHEGEEIPAYLKPRPLSNGEMDWCASTRNGGRCKWVRHFGNHHSFDPPEKLPDWLLDQ